MRTANENSNLTQNKKIQQQHCNNTIMKEQQMRTATLLKTKTIQQQHCNNSIMKEQASRKHIVDKHQQNHQEKIHMRAHRCALLLQCLLSSL